MHRQNFVFMLALVCTSLLPVPLVAEPVSSGTPLTLDQAHRMAIGRNYDVKQIDEAIRQAEIITYQAWTILSPNISAGAAITRNDKEIEFGFPDMEALINGAVSQAVAEAMGKPPPPVTPPGEGETTVIQDLWSEHYDLSINMTLFNARSIPLVKNAYDNLEASRLLGRHKRNELLFAVTAAFYGVKASKEALDLSREDLGRAEAFLELARARQAVDQGVKIEVMRAELEVMEAGKGVENAGDALKMAKTGLAYLIGLEGDFELTGPPRARPVTGEIEALQVRALKDRLDLSATRLRLTMARRSRTETWTKWVPALDVTYNHAWDSATGFSGEHDSWRLIFGARWALFDGGRKVAELAERASLARQAQYAVSGIALSIKEEVEKGVLELKKRERNLGLADRQVALAEESHRLVQQSYEHGLGTSLELLDASTTLSAARRGRILEALRRDLAALSLNKAVGMYNPLASGKP